MTHYAPLKHCILLLQLEIFKWCWSVLHETDWCEPCHAKTGLNTFVTVIPKELGLAGTSPAKSSFGMAPTIELDSVVLLDDIVAFQGTGVSSESRLPTL